MKLIQDILLTPTSGIHFNWERGILAGFILTEKGEYTEKIFIVVFCNYLSTAGIISFANTSIY